MDAVGVDSAATRRAALVAKDQMGRMQRTAVQRTNGCAQRVARAVVALPLPPSPHAADAARVQEAVMRMTVHRSVVMQPCLRLRQLEAK
mmetsp:Transcript_71884/g.138900  ORF Transcript_71884/g.138900 Transcript_71884/m.138900 type:complete len:89 (-) Transcript_71884:13-279(-)